MPKLVVGPINKGLKTDRLPFAIDNDSFPVLINAYQWRGRIKRKRGTSFLGRLQRFISGFLANTGGMGNILPRNLITIFLLEPNSSIVPGTVVITIGGITYTDNGLGILVSSGIGSGTINYAAAIVAISGSLLTTPANITFNYYPDLPVMGLEDLDLDPSAYAGTIGFDTRYAYNIPTTFPYNIYDVSFYKNIPANAGLLPGYIPKTVPTPVTWNGQNYQQFWTTNYQGAFWATNGIKIPFQITNIGMQYAPSSTIVYVSNTANTITVKITPGLGQDCPLVVGDFVFFNEWTSATPINAQGLNFQTGYVIAVSGLTTALTVTVRFPDAVLAIDTYIPGIIQYLTTQNANATDCIRWYDGDPTDGNAFNPTFLQGKGWVNFMPPLSRDNFSIANTPARQYYLAGARMILPFKDRLLFIGVVIQANGDNPIYLPDTVVYSQNGTAFYTASFTGDPSLATTQFFPILVPVNQTATPNAYWADQTGFGGFVTAGIDQPIISSESNEDVIIMGCTIIQMRFVYTGNDIVPFNFFLVNSELGTSSTFSAINMGEGILSRGDRGFVMTMQTEAKRFDLDILDNVMQMILTNNGAERITAQRDFTNEWCYFTYVDDNNLYIFPTQTLQYNYRDNSWATFNEAYTTYGQFRQKTGLEWANVGVEFPTWSSWNEPWNSGSSTILSPRVIAGNQQGFIVFRDQGTNESNSLYIQSIVGTTITAPDHCLNDGDYIVISGAVGMSNLNGNIYSVVNPTTDTFLLGYNDVSFTPTGDYIGGGLIKRMYKPFIQTKQFPEAWSIGRKTRIGVQQYLLTGTPLGKIQLLIFLSQNSAQAYNEGNIVPKNNVVNSSLIYSTTLFTCPESTNLGLTPANKSLQMISIPPQGASPQQQIWHRINTSLVGDTIQLGFTMSDSQMRDQTFPNQFEEIELHGFNIDVTQSQILA